MVKILSFNAGGVHSIPGQEDPHAFWPNPPPNIKQKRYCNKFNKDFFFNLCEGGNSKETGTRMFLRSDRTIILVVVTQLLQQNHLIVCFKWGNYMVCEYISIKLFKKRKEKTGAFWKPHNEGGKRQD